MPVPPLSSRLPRPRWRNAFGAALTSTLLAACSSGGAPVATAGFEAQTTGGSQVTAGSGGSTLTASGPATGSGGSSSGGLGLGGGDPSSTGPGCTPSTCEALGKNCGAVTDPTCGGVIECGQCPSGQACGAGGVPNVCGTGEVPCTPKTCGELGANCGSVADGCNGLLDCGTCTGMETCGGGGVPYQCGGAPGGPGCIPLDCATQGIECGQAGDGCGAVLECGTCTGEDTCGGGGEAGLCGHPVCVPQTCADQAVTCGAAGDGCGGVLSCGECSHPKTCGGDTSRPGQCGCSGLCALLPDCPAGTTTTLTGVVMDPAGSAPLPNVVVYVPNDPDDPGLRSWPATRTCTQCGETAAGNPLVSTTTAADGSFTLQGVPVGSSVTVVIQLGRWRRLFTVNVANSCGANVVTGTGTGGTTIASGVLTMPRNKAQGDIPKMAIVTAIGDNLECILAKMGIDTAEFTGRGGNGSIHLFRHPGRGASDVRLEGAYATVQDARSDELVRHVDEYDMVLLNCPGTSNLGGISMGDPLYDEWGDPVRDNMGELVDYVNGGGRLFATHYATGYLKYPLVDRGNAVNPLAASASWNVANGNSGQRSALVDIDPSRNPKGDAFAEWLGLNGALTSPSPATVSILETGSGVLDVVAPTQRWIYRDVSGAERPLHFTFNTPMGAPSTGQCGRVVVSDFHVAAAEFTSRQFPTECSTSGTSTVLPAMTASERILEYMLFDLASCVEPYTPVCTPRTCGELGVECGYASDGCGKAADCGPCPAGKACGLGGPGKCGVPPCTARTCGEQGVECGFAGDGCGQAIDCGVCPAGSFCGIGGPGKCGVPANGGVCSPLTCQAQGIECGAAGDGCGAALDCGVCPPGQVCGASAPGKCGVPPCTKTTCASQGVECGLAGDGCGGQIQCGNCPTGETCGFSEPGKCGSPTVQ